MNSFAYIHQFNGLRSGFSGLPSWARMVVAIFAIPGIALAALSVLLLVVSIIALLLLTVPVYRLLQLVCFSRPMAQQGDVTVHSPSTGRRQIDAKVIE